MLAGPKKHVLHSWVVGPGFQPFSALFSHFPQAGPHDFSSHKHNDVGSTEPLGHDPYRFLFRSAVFGHFRLAVAAAIVGLGLHQCSPCAAEGDASPLPLCCHNEDTTLVHINEIHFFDGFGLKGPVLTGSSVWRIKGGNSTTTSSSLKGDEFKGRAFSESSFDEFPLQRFVLYSPWIQLQVRSSRRIWKTRAGPCGRDSHSSIQI